MYAIVRAGATQQKVAVGDVIKIDKVATEVGGSVTLPVLLTEMPDRVVWLPMRSPGSEIGTQLGAGPGDVVRLSVAGTGGAR